jgi:hypothetical protein
MSKHTYKRSRSRSSLSNANRDDEGRFGLTRHELLTLAIAISRIWDTLYGTSKNLGSESFSNKSFGTRTVAAKSSCSSKSRERQQDP